MAVYLGLFMVEAVIEAISLKPQHVETEITGRNADQRLLDLADLVTEMRQVKHYHSKGVDARTGIEE